MRMKTAIIILSILALLVVAVVAVLQHPAFGRRMSAERKARIEASPNWRDGMFRNQIPTPQFTGGRNKFKAMRMLLKQRDSNRVHKEAIPAVKTDLKNLPANRDWFVWFGHSSYMFQLGGKRFLVDPLLKMEFPASLILKPFAGTDIYTPDDLPDIDVLIITHEHWDHLDYATLRDLRPKVKHAVCPLGVGEYLEYWKYDKSVITEMDWGDIHVFEPNNAEEAYCIHCLPSRHFSNRLLGKRNQTLWAAFLVDDGERNVYIGGDGGYDKRFAEIHERYGSVDLALLENGQYNENWRYIHTTPEDLEKVIMDLQAKQVFTVHHDKFALSVHPWSEPSTVAHDIATKHNIRLLDAPIGTIVKF